MSNAERMESLRRENVRAIKASLALSKARDKSYNKGFDLGRNIARTFDAGEQLEHLLEGIEHGYERAQRERIVTETYRPPPPRPPAEPTPGDAVDIRKWYAWPLWLIVGPILLASRTLRRQP